MVIKQHRGIRGGSLGLPSESTPNETMYLEMIDSNAPLSPISANRSAETDAKFKVLGTNFLLVISGTCSVGATIALLDRVLLLEMVDPGARSVEGFLFGVGFEVSTTIFVLPFVIL